MDERIFTNHIRDLVAGELENTQGVLCHLRRVVRRRLRKIGQWELPPKYLGYDGESWEASDALEDLVQDVYLTCVLKRLDKLAEHVEKSGTCEGSVHRKIGWYLSDRQEKGNPVARRVYRNVRAASESLVVVGKVHCSCGEMLSATSVILAPGQNSPERPESLQSHFSSHLGDSDFVASIHRDSSGSWRLLEQTIESCFSKGLTGYRVGELANLLAEACKRPGVISANNCGDGGEERTILDLLEETRTTEIQQRYQTDEELEPLISSLTKHAEATISKPRIRTRVLNSLSTIMELIQKGEDARELTTRKLALTLGVSKSTLAEDFARLRDHDKTQDASENITES